MITILGATGNTGGRVARRLTEAGLEVRAVSRSGSTKADLTDRTAMARVFDGADAAYVLLPIGLFQEGYHAHQDRMGEAITEGLRAAGVPYVVALSSLGAELAAGTGFLTSLHRQEQRLGTLDADVLYLRPGLFFESFLPSLEGIRATGVHHDTIDPAVRIPMVATRDIGDLAAAALRERRETGVREVVGPQDLTIPEAVAALGATYQPLPDEAMHGALLSAGLPADIADQHLEMNSALSSGLVHAHGTGPRSATTVVEWAQTLGVPA
jgi:uncharacterized protein YbjT (DUF2867 family)